MTSERWRQLDQLFNSALERRPEERAPFLDQACGSDDSLRREVESLLVYEERAERFITTPPDEIAGLKATFAAGGLKGYWRRRLGRLLEREKSASDSHRSLELCDPCRWYDRLC